MTKPRTSANLLTGDAASAVWPFGDLRPGHYAAILADPPWHFRTYTKLDENNWNGRRDAEKHYAVMTLDEIAALPVSQLAAPDAHLFLWTTGPHLPQALCVLEAWGFRYSGMGFVWVKLRRGVNPQQLRLIPFTEADLHLGLGHTTRKNAEFCLLGRRGSPRRKAKDVREIVLSPVREHSRKPVEVAERIERYCDGPYAELFARTTRLGWDCWGVEVDHFASPSPGDKPSCSTAATSLPPKLEAAHYWPRAAPRRSGMRAQIDAETLIDKLQSFAVGDDLNAMSALQVEVACQLLRWFMPDLHHIEMYDADSRPILVTMVASFGDVAITKVAAE
jgi:N6-adenosine-specific RNA methylase IME4